MGGNKIEIEEVGLLNELTLVHSEHIITVSYNDESLSFKFKTITEGEEIYLNWIRSYPDESKPIDQEIKEKLIEKLEEEGYIHYIEMDRRDE